MKRPLAFLTLVLLTVLIAYACGSTIRTASTSFVTITIGDTPHTALLRAEKATVLARARYMLAELKLIPEAYAYIPSVVQSIIVTVTAPDITTPIVGVSSIKPDQTTASIKIEVPNGSNRLFTIEGIRGVDSKTYYRGTVTANLDGSDINLPVTMGFVGPGIYVDAAQPLSANTPTCGSTPATACSTITYALTSRTSGTDAIIVSAGSYTQGAAAPRETFPLRLKQSTALICIGPGQSTVISASSGTGVITGAESASIDNCRIIGPAVSGYTGINEVSALNKGTMLNNVTVEMPYNTFGTIIGIALYSDSPVIESVVTFTGAPITNFMTGIQVNSGKPTIQATAVRGLGTGINLAAGAGNAVITRATITGNTTGVSIASTGVPDVTASQITNNGTGIQITGGNPSISSNLIRNNTGNGISISGSASGQITGNSIDHNNNGIVMGLATGANPRVNGNSIFCNTIRGADISATSILDLKNNAWNRDTATSIPGPIVNTGNCFNGDDICYAGPAPDYVPFSAAAVGGCP